MAETEPSETPINDAARPRMNPQIVMATRPGKAFAIRQSSRPIKSFSPMMPVMTTNAILRTAPGARPAINAPTATPTTEGRAHARTTSISTAP
jgi:hypothetical protein